MKSMLQWTAKIVAALGLILLLPLVAPAVTMQTESPVPTDEQVTNDYDSGSIQVDCEKLLGNSVASASPVPHLAPVAGFLAAKGPILNSTRQP